VAALAEDRRSGNSCVDRLSAGARQVTAGAGGARRVSDEAPVGSAPMTLRAVRRRLVNPTAVAGLDEIADHGLTVVGRLDGPAVVPLPYDGNITVG
jgi:hypothetical protein